MVQKFKLQSVLNYRQTLEDLAQQQLVGSLQQQSQLEAELQQQLERIEQLDLQLQQKQREGLMIAELELFEAQIMHYQQQIQRLQEQLTALERQILSERQLLLGAARDKQVMEKLKDKHQAEYRQELARKERGLLDEISLRNKGDRS